MNESQSRDGWEELVPPLASPMKRRGDDFGSIGIGTPFFRCPYEFFMWWSWILVGGLEDGDALLNTPDLTCEVPIPMAHNGLVKEFLKTPCDTLCIAEDDHIGDQQTIRNMREKRENWDFDIVCASYPNRRGEATVAIGVDFIESNEHGEWNCEIAPIKVAKTGTQQYDCAALGLVFIRRWLLEKMLGDNDPERFFWFDWNRANSQDIYFYGKCKQMGGVRVGVDRDNHIGHVGKKVWTMTDFWKIWDSPELREAVEDGRIQG